MLALVVAAVIRVAAVVVRASGVPLVSCESVTVAVPGSATTGVSVCRVAWLAVIVEPGETATPTSVKSLLDAETVQLPAELRVSVTVVRGMVPLIVVVPVRTVAPAALAMVSRPGVPTVKVTVWLDEPAAFAAVGTSAPTPRALTVATARARDLRILGSSRDRRRVGGDYD